MTSNQDLTIVQQVTRTPGSATNTKLIYIVEVQNSAGSDSEIYITHRVDLNPVCLEMTGFLIPYTTIAQIKAAETFTDAFEIAKTGEQESLLLPWHRVVRIKKLSFSVQSANK